jgi:hypothetical protein
MPDHVSWSVNNEFQGVGVMKILQCIVSYNTVHNTTQHIKL